ncbi:UbiD family decarboxylase [Rhodococcus opacus]|uniref:Pyrrole-2-carboxylic acid decarboxylase n=1 Tax=Rhodococcus opacus TaxID=37919 RepID=A0A076EYE0_RHOOP|nr:UbiD family decarboxylase [Rhodococcus opacus]AII10418.1 UbiD family decarboxylase [Rhodococcus opacus]
MRHHIRSLRDYLIELDELDELQEIDHEVSWNLEIGAITRRAYELPAKAPLFKRISDSERGFRVLGAPVGLSPHRSRPCTRIALSLGLPASTPATDIVEAWSRLPEEPRIPVRRVPTAPCKQNRRFGIDVDLTQVPAPILHVGDGGRYINTYGVFVAATPDGGSVNWSIARTMLRDERTMMTAAAPGQHLAGLLDQWRKIGKDMPFALALGVAPAVAMVGGYPLADHIDEREALGGWFGEPIEVVACETNDLEVPASCELVLEGTVSTEQTAEEGPMGEYAGYTKVREVGRSPIYTVDAMTFRDNPILPVVVAGVPAEENHTNWGIGVAASIRHELRTAGLPVHRCFVPFASAVHWGVVIVDDTWREHFETSRELAIAIGDVVFSCRAGRFIPKLIVVGADIDPSNLDQVVWALATRHRPDEAILYPNRPTIPLVAYLSDSERKAAASTKAVYNCLDDARGIDSGNLRVAAFADYPNELRAKIVRNWDAMGL